MIIQHKYSLALAVTLSFTASYASFSSAQNNFTKLPTQAKQHVLVSDAPLRENHLETLSGIKLYPAAKGTFELQFEQVLKENAVLEVKNKANKVVFQKPVSIAANENSWQYNLGKLKPDTYLVEVKTSDTTYWTRFKVGR